MFHYYQVFGLRVRSEISFEEFSALDLKDTDIASDNSVDVSIGATPTRLFEEKRTIDWIEASREHCLFHIEKLGRILVSGGAKIRIETFPEADLDDVRPYLITCGFATIAFQRGMLPLHLSAVQTPRGVWLFTGPSGSGKSTTAAALSQMTGWPLLGDDLTTLETEKLSLHFGVNKIKLWADAAAALGLDTANLKRDYFRPHKFHLPIKPTGSILHRDVIGTSQLEWSDHFQIQDSTQAECFRNLVNSVYPPFFAPIFFHPQDLMARLSTLFPILHCSTIYRSKIASHTTESIIEIRKYIEDRLKRI